MSWWIAAACRGVVTVLALVVSLLMTPPSATAATLDAPTGLSASDATTPVFSWDRMPEATRYRVTVSTSPSMAAPLVSDVRTTSTAYVPTIALPRDTTLFWQVKAEYPSGISDAAQSEVSTPSSTAPDMVAPERQARLTPPVDRLVFEWSPVPTASQYELQISLDPDFLSGVTTRTTKATRWADTTIPASGSWHWRVRAIFGTGLVSPWSTGSDGSPGSYTVVPLPAPTPVAPEAGTTVTDAELVWSPVAGAASYDVELSTDDQFLDSSARVFLTRVKSTRYARAQAIDNDQYYWRVRAVDAAGHVGAWPDTAWSFRRAWPEQPTQVYPSDGATIDDTDHPLFFEWTPRGPDQVLNRVSRWGLEVSTSPSFTTDVSTCTTTNTTYVPRWDGKQGCLPDAGSTVFWRVIGYDDFTGAGPQTQAIYSPVRSFTYLPRQVDLISPREGATVETPRLTWAPRAGAEHYNVVITNLTTGRTAASGSTASTDFTPRTALPPGPYRWEVRTVSRSGSIGLGTTPGSQRTFTLEQGTPAVTTLPEPLNDGVTTARFPTLEWSPAMSATSYKVSVRTHGNGAWTVLPQSFVYPEGQDDRNTSPFIAPGNYDWYVTAYQGNTALGDSPVASYRIAALPDVAGQRVALTGSSLDSDGCDASEPHSCQNLRQTPVLRWNPIDGAGYYRLYLSRDKELTNLYQAPILVDTDHWTPASTLADTNATSGYWWYVQPCTTTTGCAPLHAAHHVFNKQSPRVTGLTVDHDVDQVTLRWTDLLTSSARPENHSETTPATSATNDARYYRVQVSTSEDFTSTVDDRTVDQTFVTAPDRTYPNGPLFWRVQSLDGSRNPLSWSEIGRFSKSATPVSLRGAAPVAGAQVDGSAGLSWAATDHAVKYRVEIFENDGTPPANGNRVMSADTQFTSWAPTTPLPATGTDGEANLRWRVTAIDADGRLGDSTEPVPFEVRRSATDTTAPGPNARLANTDVLFRWRQIDEASSYRLEYRKVGSTSSTTVATPATAYAPTSPIPVGDWEWRVVTLDTDRHALGTTAWTLLSIFDRPTAPPLTVTGSAQVGTTLTTTAPTWTPSDGVVTTYQWLRDGRPIDLATGRSYVLTVADQGRNITVRATGTAPGLTPGTTESEKVLAGAGAAPALTRDLTLQGSVAVDHTVAVPTPAWNRAGVTTSYQWLLDGEPISRETSPAHRIGMAEYGKVLSVRVTGRLGGYADGVAESNSVRVAAGDMLIPIVRPTLSGSSAVRQTLAVSPGTWPGNPTLSYRWLKDNVVIRGATAQAYVVRLGDIGHKITARVYARKSGYRTASATAKVRVIPRIRTTTALRYTAATIARTARGKAVVTVVAPGLPSPLGTVRIERAGRVLASGRLVAAGRGRATITLPRLARGRYPLIARYLPESRTLTSRSGVAYLTVR